MDDTEQKKKLKERSMKNIVLLKEDIRLLEGQKSGHAEQDKNLQKTIDTFQGFADDLEALWENKDTED